MLEDFELCRSGGSYESEFDRRPIDAMIVGAQKAGTTSLLRYLCKHPRIKAHEQMEMAYFVRDSAYRRGYDAIFDTYYPEPVGAGQVLLGKAVGVMYIKEAMKRLHQHNRACKVIAVLRNPVDRAYSAYWYQRQTGWESASTFKEALALEEERIKSRGPFASHCSYMDRGRYSEQIHALTSFFGRERVLVLTFDDLVRMPSDVCGRVFRFLNLEEIEIRASQTHNRGATIKAAWVAWAVRHLRTNALTGYVRRAFKHVNPSIRPGWILEVIQRANKRTGAQPTIPVEVRRELSSSFIPEINALESLLERDLNPWKE